ncbi:MAG: 4Fe-4S dicluster domain-containing protein [Deltaproteobacteria bacterium]|nr:4Fe-4S dicluster domain-containing protein [Deltaproteobacteria bacterium]
MCFKISFYVALILFGIGMCYKVQMWFRRRAGDPLGKISAPKRFVEAVKGVFSTFFSRKLFRLVKVWVLEVFFQKQIGREGFVRWFMHFCIAYGFIFLLLMHALDRYVSQKLFAEYASTLNPFLFLRNLFGAMMLVGLGIAVYRRITNRMMRLTTRGVDIYALVVLALIAFSGFFLEATKIVSHERYEEMVSEYSSISDEQEAKALKAYWAKEFAVVFPKTKAMDSGLLAKGKEVHILNCASCHSRPKSAFVSYGLAKAISPTALVLSQKSIRESLRYFHFLVCFLGLALLPFTKFFHILTSPLVLLINGVMDRTKASPANIATVQAIELDACTHCATCSLHCSVGPIYQEIPNKTILPSEKLASLSSLASQNGKSLTILPVISEGASICTKCYRCTTVCPVGIVLQDQWLTLDKGLIHLECPEPFIRVRNAFTARFDSDRKKAIIPLTSAKKKFKQGVGLSLQGSTFHQCFTCMTCSNSCPVVVHYQNPGEKLGLLPHQIMQSLKFGIQDNVLGAGMVWDCLGCYNCQENCPQGIRVTDIFFELKNEAYQQGKNLTPGVRESGEPS